jgi:hypothetical protein
MFATATGPATVRSTTTRSAAMGCATMRCSHMRSAMGSVAVCSCRMGTTCEGSSTLCCCKKQNNDSSYHKGLNPFTNSPHFIRAVIYLPLPYLQ